MINQKKTTVKTTTATLTYSEMGDIIANSSSDFTITLPTPNKGLWYRVINANSGIVTVSDGSTTLATLNQEEHALFLANGSSGWWLTKSGGAMSKEEIEAVLTGEITTHTHPASGVDAFTELSDVPASYSEQGGKFVAVNAEATALEFVDAPTGGGIPHPYIIVGSSDNGYTSVDCDYLCDGIADQVEISDAITALGGRGTIAFLPGTYYFSAAINTGSNFVRLLGDSCSTTFFERAFDSAGATWDEYIISGGRLRIENIDVWGDSATYSNSKNCGVAATNLLELVNCSIGEVAGSAADLLGGGAMHIDYSNVYSCGMVNILGGFSIIQNSEFNDTPVNILGASTVCYDNLFTSVLTNPNLLVISGSTNRVHDNEFFCEAWGTGYPIVLDASSTNNMVCNNILGGGTISNLGTNNTLSNNI